MKPYARISEIERRFERALDLISSSHLNARQLAERLDVSLPTAQRMISELRRRGHVIRSVREEHGWRYELTGGPQSTALPHPRNQSGRSPGKGNRMGSP